MHGIYYKIEDGRIWSVDEARYLEEEESPSPAGRLIDLLSADGDGSEEYLIKTLIFYGFGLGAYEEEYGVRTALEIHKTDPAAHGINTHLADPAAHGLDGHLMDFAIHKADLAAHGNRVRLTGGLNLYVDQNSNQAGNSLIEGRGTEEFPFLDVQAAIDYVQNNYDTYKYNAIISISPGTYEENLLISALYHKSGRLQLQSKDSSNRAVLKGANQISSASLVYLYKLIIENSASSNTISNNYWYPLYNTQHSMLYIDNVTIRLTDSGSKPAMLVYSESFSMTRITGNGLTVQNDSSSLKIRQGLGVHNNSLLQINANITINNDVICDYMAYASTRGVMVRESGNFILNGTVTGQRYICGAGSFIYTRMGTEFFPGNVAGEAIYGGQYF